MRRRSEDALPKGAHSPQWITAHASRAQTSIRIDRFRTCRPRRALRQVEMPIRGHSRRAPAVRRLHAARCQIRGMNHSCNSHSDLTYKQCLDSKCNIDATIARLALHLQKLAFNIRSDLLHAKPNLVAKHNDMCCFQQLVLVCSNLKI